MAQEKILEIAPSARIYLADFGVAPSRGVERPNSILLVGNPDLDLALVPALGPLPFSGAEISAIGSVFDEATILAGSAATKEAVLGAMARSRFIHFAMHAYSSPRDPMESYFALTPNGDSGRLHAHELYETDYSGVDLVFLSGCETASGDVSRGEGAFNLARPFLAAGVPSVVGTLWEVQDSTMEKIATDFYLGMRGGMSPSEALQRAQIRSIGSGVVDLARPASWSGLAVFVGAGRSFIGGDNDNA